MPSSPAEADIKRRGMEVYPNIADSSHVLCHLVFQISDDSRISRLTLRNVHVRCSASLPGAVLWGFCCLYLLHNRCSSRVWLPYQDFSVIPTLLTMALAGQCFSEQRLLLLQQSLNSGLACLPGTNKPSWQEREKNPSLSLFESPWQKKGLFMLLCTQS